MQIPVLHSIDHSHRNRTAFHHASYIPQHFERFHGRFHTAVHKHTAQALGTALGDDAGQVDQEQHHQAAVFPGVCSSFDENEDYDLIGHLLDCRWIWLGK